MENNLLLKYYYNKSNDIDSPFLDCNKYFEELLIKNNLEKLLQIHRENNEIIKVYKENNNQLINDHYSILINAFEKNNRILYKLNEILELEPKVNNIMNNIINSSQLISKSINYKN